MDLLGNPLITGPIQTGEEYTMEPYPSVQFGFTENPDGQCGNCSVWTQTRSRSDGPEPLLTVYTTMGETHYQIKKPRPEVPEETNWGNEFPGHTRVQAPIEWHPAMLCQNHMTGYLHCYNSTSKYPQTCWRLKETSPPPPNRPSQRTPETTPELTPPLPGTPGSSTGNTSGRQLLEIVNLPAAYSYSHTFLPCAESCTLYTSVQDSKHLTDFDPDMLSDEGISTG